MLKAVAELTAKAKQGGEKQVTRVRVRAKVEPEQLHRFPSNLLPLEPTSATSATPLRCVPRGA